MICGQVANLERRCRQRGTTLDAIAACIVSRDGDTVCVDETHAAYPRPRPGLVTKAANFAASAAAHVAAGMPRATDEQVAARFAICQGCEHLQAGKCAQCGCPIVRERRLISKLAWAGESCPVGKWGPV